MEVAQVINLCRGGGGGGRQVKQRETVSATQRKAVSKRGVCMCIRTHEREVVGGGRRIIY